jgi:hypothetical protein
VRNVTVQQIADAARLHADMRGSDFISDTEIIGRINDSYCELYDELVGAYENYYVSTINFNIQAGTSLYSLPADFYKLIGVDFQVNNDAYITLRPYNEAERNITLTTNVNIPNGVIRLRYVPAPQVFSAMTDTFDGVAGWDRLVALATAIDMLDAEESNTAALTRKYGRMLQRIRDMANPRDSGFPSTVSDVYKPNIQYIYGALMYRLYQNQISLINTEFLGAQQFPPFY